MSKQISMKHFLTADRHYHVYRISHATLAVQPHHHDYYQLCCVISGISPSQYRQQFHTEEKA